MKVAGHDFEVAAVIAVVEIPVHVAQKRISFASCSNTAHQSMFVAPGSVLGQSLSLG